MNALTLMEIKDRTWTIQACSAVTKEGKITIVLIFAFYRSSRGHGMVSQNNLREEMSIKMIVMTQ